MQVHKTETSSDLHCAPSREERSLGFLGRGDRSYKRNVSCCCRSWPRRSRSAECREYRPHRQHRRDPRREPQASTSFTGADCRPLGPVQEAFSEVGAFQCAFRTPGFVLMMKQLLNEIPDPRDSPASLSLWRLSRDHLCGQARRARRPGDASIGQSALQPDPCITRALSRHD